MKQGDVVRATVESIAAGGEGVCRAEGMTVFVENAVPGDELDIRLTQVKKNYAKGKILSFIALSPDRVEPPCKYFEQCGACQLQHISYPAQLKIKSRIAKDALSRIGGISESLVSEIIGMENPWGYRNKMQYPLQEQKFKVQSAKFKGKSKSIILMGYYKKGTHQVVDIEECLVLHPELNKIANAVRKGIGENRISIYDEDSGQGVLRHILAKTAFGTGESILAFVINSDEMPGSKNLVRSILDNIGDDRIKGFSMNINTRRTNVILGERTKDIWGKGYITEQMGELRFMISPASFFQINPVQAQILFDKVKEYGEFTGDESVIDAYCGTGSIALWIAGSVKEVYGIEEVSDAISDAKANAKLNNIRNAFFRCGTVEKLLAQYMEAGIKPDAVILDPPRSGCAPEVLDSVVRMAPKKVIYVSCDPATLARDIKILSSKYEVNKIQPVDMFPHTAHVECVAELKLGGAEERKR